MGIEDGEPGPMAVAMRWAGRVASLLSLGVLSLFVAGEPPWPWRLSASELALVACFPVGLALGMVLAWWREGLGGMVAALAVAGFYLVSLLGSGRWPGGPWFLVFASPAAFFLASWAMRRAVRRWPRSAPGPTGTARPG